MDISPASTARTEDPSGLAAKIAEALRRAPTPLRAKDIVVELAKNGTTAQTKEVNKALYSGSRWFVRVSGAGAAPAWALKCGPSVREQPALAAGSPAALTAQVPGVGSLALEPGLSPDNVRALLTALAAPAAEGARKRFSPGSDDAAAALAAELGYAAV